jgi:triacylglycerol esterase/lipase EstA (alpha/beta hydrolase family)
MGSMRRGRLRAGAFAVLVALVAAAVGCTPTVGSSSVPKDPVVIVAGTTASGPIADVAYAPLASRLRADGYRTYIFGLPNLGLTDIRDTSAALDHYVDTVLAQTGAAHVDLIGHSQGGLVARYFVKYLGGDQVVDSLVSLAAPHHGSVEANIASLLLGLGTCLGSVACQQMSVGSSFLADLNDGDDTIGDVQYTNLVTALDEFVVPATSGFLADDGNNRNVMIQTQCPLRIVGHLTMATDGTVYTGIRHALRHEAISLDCLAV